MLLTPPSLQSSHLDSTSKQTEFMPKSQTETIHPCYILVFIKPKDKTQRTPSPHIGKQLTPHFNLTL